MNHLNYDVSIEINHNASWSYISDHPYRTLIISGSGLAKQIITELNKLSMIKY